MIRPNTNAWALVTGASSGIGEAFAKRFAADGWNVILTARSAPTLETLARSLTAQHAVRTLVIPADLAEESACLRIYQTVREADIHVDCLVNNAGFGAVGPFERIPLASQLDMVDVNVKSLLALTHLFLPGMKERRHGIILNVSSTASFQPIPFLNTYSATKAFVTSFSESLWAECLGTGVRVLNICPGKTRTNFAVRAGQPNNPKDIRPVQTSEEVVAISMKAVNKRMPTVICGFMNKLLYWIQYWVPRRWVVMATGRVAKAMGYGA